MYIQIPENSKCSICGARNFTEIVSRDNCKYKRCRKCGHEKLISQLTTNTDSCKYYTIDLRDYNSEDIF
jgi:hypothetical protein